MSVVVIGMFDGVHIGHQKLLRKTVDLARRQHTRSIAVTFDPDPHQVLHADYTAPALMPLTRRCDLMRAQGIDRVVVIPFTRSFARVRARSFLERVLVGKLKAKICVTGTDFAFGYQREGTVAFLRKQAPALGLQVISLDPVRRQGKAVSSSRIRRLIRQGKLARASGLLGHKPALYGRVVQGDGRGRQLGFPTANLHLIDQVVPPQGVYCVRMHTRTACWNGVMNLGCRPTFGPNALLAEIHLLHFKGTVLHKQVFVELLKRLRAERCFASVPTLKAQIRRDIRRARHYFLNNS